MGRSHQHLLRPITCDGKPVDSNPQSWVSRCRLGNMEIDSHQLKWEHICSQHDPIVFPPLVRGPIYASDGIDLGMTFALLGTNPLPQWVPEQYCCLCTPHQPQRCAWCPTGGNTKMLTVKRWVYLPSNPHSHSCPLLLAGMRHSAISEPSWAQFDQDIVSLTNSYHGNRFHLCWPKCISPNVQANDKDCKSPSWHDLHQITVPTEHLLQPIMLQTSQEKVQSSSTEMKGCAHQIGQILQVWQSSSMVIPQGKFIRLHVCQLQSIHISKLQYPENACRKFSLNLHKNLLPIIVFLSRLTRNIVVAHNLSQLSIVSVPSRIYRQLTRLDTENVENLMTDCGFFIFVLYLYVAY